MYEGEAESGEDPWGASAPFGEEAKDVKELTLDSALSRSVPEGRVLEAP